MWHRGYYPVDEDKMIKSLLNLGLPIASMSMALDILWRSKIGYLLQFGNAHAGLYRLGFNTFKSWPPIDKSSMNSELSLTCYNW